jgi:hypothetical protein
MTARVEEWVRKSITRQGYAALYVAGFKEIIPRNAGDNYGCRPIKIGVSIPFTDGITKYLDGASPLYWCGVLFRLWCESVPKAKALEQHVARELKEQSDPLRKSWIDLGPELDVGQLQEAIRLLGEDFGIRTWTDKELVEFVKSQERQRVKRVRSGAYV